MTRRRRLCFATMMLSLVIPAARTIAATTAGTSASASEAASLHSSNVPASCPVTLPSHPAFIPPGPYPQTPPDRRSFWHGTSGLWTMLGPDGAMGARHKVFWWSPGFHPVSIPDPPLKIAGRRLDGDAPALAQPWVTNAHVPEWGGWSMLIMLEPPTAGCWEVTGSYGGDTVTFVVWVTPPPPRA